MKEQSDWIEAGHFTTARDAATGNSCSSTPRAVNCEAAHMTEGGTRNIVVSPMNGDCDHVRLVER